MIPGVYRLKVPFEELYTTVFALVGESGCALLDTATTDDDVRGCILPWLQKGRLSPTLLLASHLHSDHAGGMPALLEAFPQAQAGVLADSAPFGPRTRQLYDGDVLFGRFQILSLPGHTPDSMGVLDLATRTLLSCDCLQQRGIGKYRSGVSDREAYARTLDRVEALAPDRIVFSHDYDPCGTFADGPEAVRAALAVCRESL